MLKLEDLEIQAGRAVGGDFMKILHKPTEISRAKGPPLNAPGKTKQALLAEIETELIQLGLTQHIIPQKNAD